jgi:hypothetical protein
MRCASCCVLLAACSFHVHEQATPRDGAVDSATDAPAIVDAPPDAPSTPIAFVQANAHVASGATASTSFNGNVTAGNCEIVIVSWYMAGTLSSLNDTGSNNLQLAGEVAANGITQRLYYATNIAGGANTVTATWQASVQFPEVRVLEYSGIAATNVVDVYNSNSGTSPSAGSLATVGPIATTRAHDLILVAETGDVNTASANYMQRISTVGDFVEDQEVQASGSYSASMTENFMGPWTMQIAAFRGAN